VPEKSLGLTRIRIRRGLHIVKRGAIGYAEECKRGVQTRRSQLVLLAAVGAVFHFAMEVPDALLGGAGASLFFFGLWRYDSMVFHGRLDLVRSLPPTASSAFGATLDLRLHRQK